MTLSKAQKATCRILANNAWLALLTVEYFLWDYAQSKPLTAIHVCLHVSISNNIHRHHSLSVRIIPSSSVYSFSTPTLPEAAYTNSINLLSEPLRMQVHNITYT